MSIKAKIQIFLGFVMLSALLLLDVLFTNFLITSAGEADRERLTRELSRTVMSVKGEERMLTAIAGNWAYSDNTWNFMNGKYPEYPKAYLNRDVLTEIGISSMIYLDKDLGVVLFRDFSAPDDASTPQSEFNAIFSTEESEKIFKNLPNEGFCGIVMKTNAILLAVIIGISQGCQPIFSYNYGAGKYSRVRETYRKAIIVATLICCAAFLCFQLFPRQIAGIFDASGSELYFQFSERYFRIFMLMTFVNAVQPITSNFFTSIGKAKKGILISLTRQVIFLIPLILIFPLFWGIDGVMYAGPIADSAALAVAFLLTRWEMKRMPTQDRLQAA